MKKLFALMLIVSLFACNNETPIKDEKASQVKDTTVVDSTHLKK